MKSFNFKVIDHLSFYSENKISPVNQNILNLKKHFMRRSYLYNKLGISKNLISKSRVLEIGPGSGHNSLYTANCNPLFYDIVEPNKSAIKEIRKNFKKNKIKIPNINNITLEKFKNEIKYDIIICEGWIGSLENEIKLIKKIYSLLNKNGFMLITYQPATGMLANVLRKIISYKVLKADQNIKKKTSVLLDFFNDELLTLKNMSRNKKDWVQDVIINPAIIGSFLTPETIINQINDYSIFETYPKFTDDWSWYKDHTYSNKDQKKFFFKFFYENYLNFLDFTGSKIIISEKEGLRIEKILYDFYYEIFEVESKNFENYEYLTSYSIKLLNNLKSKFKNNKKLTSIITETLNFLKQKNNKKKYDVLKKTFGRELNYINIQKTK